MKNISTLLIMLTLICHSRYYSQGHPFSKKDHAQIKKNSKGLSLEIGDLKTIEKNGKTSWTVKSTLTNNSRDTVFYFITTDCESANFMAWAMVDTISLFADFEPCDVAKQTVVALPPKGQRTINVMLSSQRPVTSSFRLKAFLHLAKATNKDERMNHDILMRKRDRRISVQSNKIKVIVPADKSKSA